MGYPVGPHYAECSNVDNAHRLRGKLLLIVGELDTNVPPESTLRVVDALIKADKDFDLLVVPGAGHGMGGAYGAAADAGLLRPPPARRRAADRNAESSAPRRRPPSAALAGPRASGGPRPRSPARRRPRRRWPARPSTGRPGRGGSRAARSSATPSTAAPCGAPRRRRPRPTRRADRAIHARTGSGGSTPSSSTDLGPRRPGRLPALPEPPGPRAPHCSRRRRRSASRPTPFVPFAKPILDLDARTASVTPMDWQQVAGGPDPAGRRIGEARRVSGGAAPEPEDQSTAGRRRGLALADGLRGTLEGWYRLLRRLRSPLLLVERRAVQGRRRGPRGTAAGPAVSRGSELGAPTGGGGAHPGAVQAGGTSGRRRRTARRQRRSAARPCSTSWRTRSSRTRPRS